MESNGQTDHILVSMFKYKANTISEKKNMTKFVVHAGYDVNNYNKNDQGYHSTSTFSLLKYRYAKTIKQFKTDTNN